MMRSHLLIFGSAYADAQMFSTPSSRVRIAHAHFPKRRVSYWSVAKNEKPETNTRWRITGSPQKEN